MCYLRAHAIVAEDVVHKQSNFCYVPYLDHKLFMAPNIWFSSITDENEIIILYAYYRST